MPVLKVKIVSNVQAFANVQSIAPGLLSDISQIDLLARTGRTVCELGDNLTTEIFVNVAVRCVDFGSSCFL
jgi:hypothetical protein